MSLAPSSIKAAGLLALLAVALLPIACSEPTAEEKLATAEQTLLAAEDLRDRAVAALERRETEHAAALEALEAARTRARDARAQVEELRRMVQEIATDDLLFRQVQAALLEDRKLSTSAIAARVDDGVVTLDGLGARRGDA